MDARLRGICDDLLSLEGISEKYRNIVYSILQKDKLASVGDAEYQPTETEIASIRRAEAIWLLGKARYLHKPQMRYKHTQVVKTDTGFYIMVEGVRIPIVTTRKEGPAIARFISEAYDSLKSIIGDAKETKDPF